MQKNMKKYDHHGHPKYCYSFSLARLVLLSNIIIVTPGIVIVNLQVGIVCYPISSSPPQVMLLLFSGLVLQPQVGVCTVDPALLELVKKLKFKSSAVGEAIVMKVCFCIPVFLYSDVDLDFVFCILYLCFLFYLCTFALLYICILMWILIWIFMIIRRL